MKLNIIKFIVCLMAIVVASTLPLRISAEDSDRVLAVGEGFEITKCYVQAIEDFYKLQSFTSTPDQYLKVAVRTRLFALEANALGLDPVRLDVDESKINPDTVQEYDQVMNFIGHLEYSEAYTAYLRENFKVPSEVIVSYYHAHAERFHEDDISDDSLPALTPEIENKIRRIILRSKQKDIFDQAYEDLFQKYGVTIYD